MKGRILYWIMVLALVLGTAPTLVTPVVVEATANIDLVRSPNPPCYLLNDGATPEAFWWKITFDTVPDEAVFMIRDPDGIVVHTEIFDLTGKISPVYNSENGAGDAGMGDPAYAHNWSFSGGAKAGVYEAELEFWSLDVGLESSATQTFWIRQRVQVYKYNDLNGNGSDDGEPPLSGWDFAVTGPESFSGTTDSTGYAIFPSRNPTSPCALGTEAYRDVLLSGTYNVTETLKPGWTSTDPGGSAPYQKSFTVPDPAGETIVVEFGNEELNPQLCIDKTVDFDNDAVFTDSETFYAGEPADWAIKVTNTGYDPVYNITVSDDNMGVDFYGPFDLGPGEFEIVPVYTTHPTADFLNTACAQGVDEIGGTVGPVCDPAEVTVKTKPPVGGTAYPPNKLLMLAPWIALGAAIIAGIILLVRRRRRAMA